MLLELRNNVNSLSFETWLRPTRFARVDGDSLVVTVPTAEFSEMIEQKFAVEIAKALETGGNGFHRVMYEWPEPVPVEVEEPEEKPAPAPEHTECPIPPDEIWYGLSRDYRAAVSPCAEAPDAYHFAGFLTAAAAGLGKSVYITDPTPDLLYTTIFSVTVGPSGEGNKTVSQGFASKLIRATDPTVSFMRKLNSPQGITRFAQNTLAKDPRRKQSSIVISLNELRNLIDKAKTKGAGELISTLCDCYDNQPLVENTGTDPLEVPEPPMWCLQAATTQEWMRGMDERDLEGGLNRIVFIPGVPKAPISFCRPPDLETVSYRLTKIFDHWDKKSETGTRLKLTPRARDLWNDWYHHRDSLSSDDALIKILAQRHRSYVLKIAGIWTALDETEEIDEAHLQPAVHAAHWLYRSLLYIFRDFGMTKIGRLEEKIVRKVEESGRKGIGKRTCRRLVAGRVSWQIYQQAVFWLTRPGGPIFEADGGLTGRELKLYPCDAFSQAERMEWESAGQVKGKRY